MCLHWWWWWSADSRAYRRSAEAPARTIAIATPCCGERGGTVTLATSRPGTFRWHRADGQVYPDPVASDPQGARVDGVLPGDYTVAFEPSGSGAAEELLLRVTESRVPTIIGYRVRAASGEWSRDGEVTALTNLRDVDVASLTWSSGHQTSGTTLRGVRPGEYVAVVTTVNDALTSCIHACAPARVPVRVG